MNVATFELPTPRGTLRGATTEVGLALVTLPGGDFDAQYAARFGANTRRRDGRGHAARRELARYLSGSLRAFTVPLDLAGRTPFAERVLRALCEVPFGDLITYGGLARAAGCPGGARAVGGAVGGNPVPIVVPCHRVVAAERRLGGFSGGLDNKRWLLAHEGVLDGLRA